MHWSGWPCWCCLPKPSNGTDAWSSRQDSNNIQPGERRAGRKRSVRPTPRGNNYEKAVELDTKNSLGYSRIGSLWYEAHNYNDALSNYTKAKDNDANNPLPYRDLANAYYWIGKYDLAKQNIERYIELSDQSLDDKKKYADMVHKSKDHFKRASDFAFRHVKWACWILLYIDSWVKQKI